MNRKLTRNIAAVASLATVALTCGGIAIAQAKTTGKANAAVGYSITPYSKVKAGGTMKLAVDESPTDAGNWNANTAEGAELDAIDVEAPTTGSLTVFKADGSWKADPDYAKSVKLISTKPQVVDVKLNPKAVWQDGTKITSADYKATFAALSGKNKAFDIASSAGFNDVKTFKVVSPTEFKVTFDKPYADWPAIFGGPVPASIASDPTKWASYTNQPLPSDGPFIFSKIDNDAKVYTLVRNPKWWGRTPKLAGISFQVIAAGSAQAQAFVNGEINADEVDQDVDSYKTAKGLSGATVERSSGLTWSQVTFNGDKWPTNDVHVRQAIAHALNRAVVAKTANQAVGFPAVTQGSWIFVPGQAGYTNVVGTKLGFSDAKATSILKADGWKLQNGGWYKKGKQLKLQITITQSSATEVQRAAIITAGLQAIHIPVEYNNVPTADLFNDIFQGQFNMATFSWAGTPYPISSSESLFYPAQKPSANPTGQNFAFVTDKKLGPLWAKANAELNPTKRLKDAQAIDNEIATYVPMVPFAPSPMIYVVDGNVANYGPAEFLTTDWTSVGFKK